MNSLVTKFASKINVDEESLIGKNRIENRDCYDELINYFNDDCVPLHMHTYLLRHLYLFLNTCNQIKKQNSLINTNDLTAIISEHCSPFKDSFISMSKVI